MIRKLLPLIRFVLILCCVLLLPRASNAIDTSALLWGVSLYVLDSDGNPLDTDTSCSFALANCDGTSEAWSENLTCSFSGGNTSVSLGEVEPLS